MSQTARPPRNRATLTFRGVKVTPRQEQLLRFVVAFIRDEQRCPTFREIGGHMGIGSPNGVDAHLTALEKKGLVVKGDKTTRSIRVVGLDVYLRAAIDVFLEVEVPGE